MSITINDISSTQLVNPNVGDYRIIAVKSGNVNYKSIQDSMDIKITKASQNPLILLKNHYLLVFFGCGKIFGNWGRLLLTRGLFLLLSRA